MFDETNAYCSINVDAEIKEADLAQKLAHLFGTTPDGNYVDTDNGTIGILTNDDFDSELRKDSKRGFIYYNIQLEVEPKVELGEENAVHFVSKILKYLWSEDYPATAACAYEDALPNKGKLIPENHSWNEYYIWK